MTRHESAAATDSTAFSRPATCWQPRGQSSSTGFIAFNADLPQQLRCQFGARLPATAQSRAEPACLQGPHARSQNRQRVSNKKASVAAVQPFGQRAQSMLAAVAILERDVCCFDHGRDDLATFEFHVLKRCRSDHRDKLARRSVENDFRHDFIRSDPGDGALDLISNAIWHI